MPPRAFPRIGAYGMCWGGSCAILLFEKVVVQKVLVGWSSEVKVDELEECWADESEWWCVWCVRGVGGCVLGDKGRSLLPRARSCPSGKHNSHVRK